MNRAPILPKRPRRDEATLLGEARSSFPQITFFQFDYEFSSFFLSFFLPSLLLENSAKIPATGKKGGQGVSSFVCARGRPDVSKIRAKDGIVILEILYGEREEEEEEEGSIFEIFVAASLPEGRRSENSCVARIWKLRELRVLLLEDLSVEE